MSNSDAKILSAVFCHPLNELSKVTVAPLQKCVKGRQMRTNVVQAESWGLQQELLAHDSAAILSTDFSAAFPSLLHVRMFAVLNAMNVPSFITNFYFMLYKSNQGVVTLGGQKFGSLPIQRGCVRATLALWPSSVFALI
eukprot:9473384-Pyramimonas_sp.AAC.1